MGLIDKAAVVAEIKELIRANELYLSKPETDEIKFQKTGAYSVLNDLLHSLDTIKVKEAGLEKEIELVKGDYEQVDVAWNNDFDYIARHFFELGLKTQSKSIWHPMSEKIYHPCLLLIHGYGSDVWICDAADALGDPIAKEWAYVDDVLRISGLQKK